MTFVESVRDIMMNVNETKIIFVYKKLTQAYVIKIIPLENLQIQHILHF